MLRISFAALGIYLSTLIGYSQPPDSTLYKDRKLKLEEVNFVTSYYRQDGNNSAVTGGIGSEKMTDFASTIDVKLSRYNRRNRLNTFTAEVGFDVYTSASSDNIDPNTISSASSMDTRFYPSLTWAITDEKERSTVSYNVSASTEYDYFAKGMRVGWTKTSRDGNREFGAAAQAFLDTWSVILPVELRGITETTSTKPRNSYSASFSLSQILTKRLQMILLADLAWQQGQLATLYHRTYFTDGTHQVENLPDSRWKIPIGLRMHYFLGDRYILRTFYRYYADEWGLKAHTVEIETPVKITPFFSVSPFYRYYTQKGADYFRGFQQHDQVSEFYTSDYDLSTLNSNMAGLGLRFSTPSGLMGIGHFSALELRYAHYERSTGLASDIISLLAKFK